MGRNSMSYGWIPDFPDFRDYKYQKPIAEPEPGSVDLRSTGLLPPVFDQGDLASCTANAAASAFFYIDKKQTGISVLPSRLYIYYNTRIAENNQYNDSGAQLRTTIKTIIKTGICVDALWPYNLSKFIVTPPAVCYQAAKRHVATEYRSVSQGDDIKHCLSEGFPVMCGLSVYESFKSDQVAGSGIVTIPGKTEKLLGGHAVLLVGHTSTGFIGMNSWGKNWGTDGFFEIPYDYVYNPDLAADFWTLRAVSKAN